MKKTTAERPVIVTTVHKGVFFGWRSDKDGNATNGGRSKEPARAGLVEEIAGPLRICTAKGLHATMQPEGYNGERIWVVALFGEVQWSDDKCAALKREIIGELIWN